MRRETHIGHLKRRAKSDYECLRASDRLKHRADEFFKVIQSAKYKPHKIIEEEEIQRETHTGTRTNVSDTSIESVEKSARRGKLFVCQKIPYATSTEPKLKDSGCQTREPDIEVISRHPYHRSHTDDTADDNTVIHVVTTRHHHNKQEVLIRKPKTKKQVYAFIGTLADDLPPKCGPSENRIMEDVDVDAMFPTSRLPKRSFQSDALIKSMANKRRGKDPTKNSIKVQFRDEENGHDKHNTSATVTRKERGRTNRRHFQEVRGIFIHNISFHYPDSLIEH